MYSVTKFSIALLVICVICLCGQSNASVTSQCQSSTSAVSATAVTGLVTNIQAAMDLCSKQLLGVDVMVKELIKVVSGMCDSAKAAV